MLSFPLRLLSVICIFSASLFSYAFASESLYFNYYDTSTNANWETVGNWYVYGTPGDPAHVLSGYLPAGGIDDVITYGSLAPEVNLDTWTAPNNIEASRTGIIFTGHYTSLDIPVNLSFDEGSPRAIFTDFAVNNATITGHTVVFRDGSRHVGTINGNAIFEGDDAINDGIVTGTKTRLYTQSLATVLDFTNGWTVVANGATVDISGANHDNTTIFVTQNGGSFTGLGQTPRYFYDQHNGNPGDCDWTNSANWYVDAAMMTPLGGLPISSDDVVVLPGSCLNATHNDTATWTFPASLDAGNNSLEFWYGTSFPITTTGNVSFIGGPGSSTSVTAPITADVINFDEYTSNDSTLTVSGNAIFSQFGSNSSMNNGIINGNAIFYSTSSNTGTINGDATFYEDASENTGTITGAKTRYYTQATTTTRDFYTDGPWTVIADSVAVDISGADYDSNTTFLTQNGGSFVGIDQAPTITNITTSSPNGSYRYIPGDVDNYIMLDVTFSENVTGSATLTLETGTNDRTCDIVVSDSATATCQYFIEAGDTTSDLNVSSISGSIVDGASNAMTNFVPVTNLAANKAIVIDSTEPGAPTVTTPTEHAQIVGINSTVTGTCEVGGTVSVSNEYFTNPLIKNTSCSLDGTFSVAISWKTTTPVNTSQTLNFVQYDAAGNVSNPITRVVDYSSPDTTAPTITNITTSIPNGAYRYIPFDVDNYIMLDVTVSENITGSLGLTLETGVVDGVCTATFSNSSTATCQYWIEPGHTSSDLTVSSISGSVVDEASNAMTNFVPGTNLAANKNIVIDTTVPIIPTIAMPTEHTQIIGMTSTASGTCEAGATVTISNLYLNPRLTHTNCIDGTFSVTLSWLNAPANVSQTLNFLQTDAAGNMSSGVTVVVDYPVQQTSSGGGGGGSVYVDKNVDEKIETTEKTPEKAVQSIESATTFESKTTTSVSNIVVEFEPFATREKTISIALKLSGIEVTGMYICQNKFTDTPTPYSCEVAEKSQSAGLISNSRSTFRPERSVTRIEAYSIFMQSVCAAPETNENNWKKLTIKKAIELGFTERTLETFRPDRAISTSEMFALAKQIGEWKTNNPNSCK